ncbi:SDR family NAD(P)-dependent oxidoreductase [Rhodococcoides yunnanense]|uniref:3-oxoacyl-[acyl-carrier-protein] reductase MabA n=1 Tax=Rhodococcoides yunnanense TaxID=278209 RepID=A0ABU4BL42_9NOCA|nr:SDR family NAD(P)-dependent oxidoreductase [Rhodococcus yunnanensis]MDV6264929.1 SDR family NAD(P)-dependent oxidoreductase [Rhodococcus yunnanensis]
MDLQLNGKRALVTGSNGGIGAATAQLLADEGVSVEIHGRNQATLAKTKAAIAARGGAVASAAGDLSTDEGAHHVGAAGLDAFGGFDILVNNARGASDTGNGSWFDLPPSGWATAYQANVISAGRLIHYVIPGIRMEGWGRIIETLSGAGIVPMSGQPDYGPSKVAPVNMSMGLSKALAGSGITVNNVSTGMVMTPKLAICLAGSPKCGVGRRCRQSNRIRSRGHWPDGHTNRAGRGRRVFGDHAGQPELRFRERGEPAPRCRHYRIHLLVWSSK